MEEIKKLYLYGSYNNIMGSDLVFKNNEGQPVTSSLLVAQKFGKQHKHVLRAIRDLEANISEVTENECKPNFGLTSQLVEQPNANLLLKLYRIKGPSRRYNKVIFFEQAVRLIQQVDISRWPHTLPTTSRRLREKYYRYLREGHESLIHKGFNNQHARKS